MAIVFSDVHLSLRAPIARSNEADWMRAMEKPLTFLRSITKTYPEAIPLCAGDIFHRWDSKPELINFALQHLPDNMWAVPGQHDLPLHDLKLIHKSAFLTLVHAGKVRVPSPVGTQFTVHNRDMWVYGFPYSCPIMNPGVHDRKDLKVALVHDYLWILGRGHRMASPTRLLRTVHPNLKGYDAAIYGDNHQGFLRRRGPLTVFNCGGFMRRAADERDYRPQIGLLMSDGSVQPIRIPIEGESLMATASAPVETGDVPDFSEVMNELDRLHSTAEDFSQAVHRILDRPGVPKDVRRFILEAMGNG